MKLAVTATQRGITDKQKEFAENFIRMMNPSAVIHGCCTGGDDNLDEIADRLRIMRIGFPSSIKRKCALDRCLQRKNSDFIVAREPMAPLKRNPLIVKSGDKLLACPQQEEEVIRSGTWTTIRAAIRILGRSNVVIISPTGKLL